MTDFEILSKWGPVAGLFILLVLVLIWQVRSYTKDALKREQEAVEREKTRIIEAKDREDKLGNALDEQRKYINTTLLCQLQSNTKASTEHTSAIIGLTDALKGVHCINAVHMDKRPEV